MHPSGFNLSGRLFRLWSRRLRGAGVLGSCRFGAIGCLGSAALILAQVTVPLREHLLEALRRAIQPGSGLGILDVEDALRFLDDTRLNGSNLNVFATEPDGNHLTGSGLCFLFLTHVTFPRGWPSIDNINITYYRK